MSRRGYSGLNDNSKTTDPKNVWIGTLAVVGALLLGLTILFGVLYGTTAVMRNSLQEQNDQLDARALNLSNSIDDCTSANANLVNANGDLTDAVTTLQSEKTAIQETADQCADDLDECQTPKDVPVLQAPPDLEGTLVFSKGIPDGSFFFPITVMKGAKHPDYPGQTILYIAQQNGWIWSLDEQNNNTLFLDASADVTTAGEGGLIAMEFHPNFGVNGESRFWLRRTLDSTAGSGVGAKFPDNFSLKGTNFTVWSSGHHDEDQWFREWTDRETTRRFASAIEEYHLNGANQPELVKTILIQAQPERNHVGQDTLIWDPIENKLVVSFGDGSAVFGSEELSQGTDELCGHAFLMDVDAIPGIVPTPIVSKFSELPPEVSGAMTPILSGIRNMVGMSVDVENEIRYLGHCMQYDIAQIHAVSDWSRERNLGWPYITADKYTTFRGTFQVEEDFAEPPSGFTQPGRVSSIDGMFASDGASTLEYYDVTASVVVLNSTESFGCGTILQDLSGKIAYAPAQVCGSSTLTGNVAAAGAVGLISSLTVNEATFLGLRAIPWISLAAEAGQLFEEYLAGSPSDVRMQSYFVKRIEVPLAPKRAKTLSEFYSPTFVGYMWQEGRLGLADEPTACWLTPTFYKGEAIPEWTNSLVWMDFARRDPVTFNTDIFPPARLLYGAADPNEPSRMRLHGSVTPAGLGNLHIWTSTGKRGETGDIFVAGTDVTTIASNVYRIHPSTGGGAKKSITTPPSSDFEMPVECDSDCMARYHSWMHERPGPAVTSMP